MKRAAVTEFSSVFQVKVFSTFGVAYCNNMEFDIIAKKFKKFNRN